MSGQDQPNPSSTGGNGQRSQAGMPRWVKGFLIAALVVALLVVAAMAISGGEHGPGRHMSSTTGYTQPSISQPSENPASSGY
jgi:hypothetical protein